MKLLNDDALERSAIVANCRMNRERNLQGSNGYDRELGFDPLAHLKERTTAGGTATWLDLCCGTGRALIQTALIVQAEQQAIDIVGVDLVGMFDPSPPDLPRLRLVEASLSAWRPDRSFELITCIHGLHYVGDKLRLIACAASWLREDGLFMASLDLHNLKIEGDSPARRLVSDLRRGGLRYDTRRRLASCRGRKRVSLPYRYLGADDTGWPQLHGAARRELALRDHRTERRQAMIICLLHGWPSVPGGVKPTYLASLGHRVLNPKLSDEGFAEALRIAPGQFELYKTQIVVGSRRGGAVAMNIDSGGASLVLLSPAWKRCGSATTVKPGTIILDGRADDVVPFAETEAVVRNSRLPGSALIEVGTDHRLADPEPLERMLRASEEAAQQAAGPAHRLPRYFLTSAHPLVPSRSIQSRSRSQNTR